jgi:2-isopropylmalate synthase
MALKVRRDHFKGLYTDINTKELYKTSRLLCRITGTFVQPNKAIVGDNAFAHESGIHQHGVLAKRETYEIMNPEDVGFPKSKIILGKHSGRHALKAKLKELGYDVDDKTLNQLFEKFKELADRKKEVYEEDLEALIYEQFRSSAEEDFIRLKHLQVQTGNNILPTATVKVVFKGKEKTATETGNGPVDAAIKAIQKATEIYPKFVDYSIKALTPNTDAQAEARAVIELDDIKASGRASDIDIVNASVKAYIDALNRLLARREYLKAKRETRKSGTV